MQTPSNEMPKEAIPQVELPEITKTEITKENKVFSIEKISQLIMYQSGTATVAPTHSPRNFYEQIVFKDDGSNKRLWIWSQYSKEWKYVAFT